MNHTWTPKPSSQDKVDGALDAALSRGGPVMLNTGTCVRTLLCWSLCRSFYGNPPNGTANLDVIGDWMRRNEDRASQFVISLKGGMDFSKHAPDTSEAFLRREIEDAAKRLAPGKIAIFECARVDKSRPQEEVMKTLVKLRDEGLFQHIGLSECSAETIRKSHAVAPCAVTLGARTDRRRIAGVEVEYSPWSLDIERNGVLSTCQELGIAILACECALSERSTDVHRQPAGQGHADRIDPQARRHPRERHASPFRPLPAGDLCQQCALFALVDANARSSRLSTRSASSPRRRASRTLSSSWPGSSPSMESSRSQARPALRALKSRWVPTTWTCPRRTLPRCARSWTTPTSLAAAVRQP